MSDEKLERCDMLTWQPNEQCEIVMMSQWCWTESQWGRMETAPQHLPSCYKHLQSGLGANSQQLYPHAHCAGAFFLQWVLCIYYINAYFHHYKIMYTFTTSENKYQVEDNINEVLRLWQTHKNNFTKFFEEEFEYVSTCQHCWRWCKMHFCFIFKISAFRGVHGKIFGFIFGFILWSFFCQTSKMIQKWSQKWAKNYLKMATMNNPIVRPKPIT